MKKREQENKKERALVKVVGILQEGRRSHFVEEKRRKLTTF